jgi:hypothetical protein
MERKDNEGVRQALAAYREKGVVSHAKTLSIPMEQRIPALIEQPGGRDRVVVAVSSSLVSAFQNIKNAKMDADQILDLADMIIDSAHEDQLSIEDVLLFLKDLLMGKYGKVSSALDYPAFFELFEEYRDERYRTIRKIRWEEHLTMKSLGDSNRSFDGLPLKRNDDPGAMLDLMQTYYSNE